MHNEKIQHFVSEVESLSFPREAKIYAPKTALMSIRTPGMAGKIFLPDLQVTE